MSTADFLTNTEEALAKELHALRSKSTPVEVPLSLIPYLSHLHYVQSRNRTHRQLWLVSDDQTALELVRAWESIRTLQPKKYEFAALVSWGVIPYSFTLSDKEKEYQRTRATHLIHSTEACLLVASIEGISQFITVPDKDSSVQTVKKGATLSRSHFIAALAQYGFAQINPVTRPGEFSVKGNIIDLFPPDREYPVRLDFFGDEVESIKAFSHETQRSTENLTEVRVAALQATLTNIEAAVDQFIKKNALQGKLLPPILQTSGLNLAGFADLYPALQKTVSALDVWTHDLFVFEPEKVLARLGSVTQERTYLFEKSESAAKLRPNELFVENSTIEEKLLSAREVANASENSAWVETPKFGGRLGLLKDFIENKNRNKIWYFIESENQRERLLSALADFQPVNLIGEFYPHGFTNGETVVFTEHDIFGRVVRKYAADKNISRLIESYTDLKEGDYVVHVNYGIARFASLKRMKVQQNERDFLELSFSDGDKLFVPLDQLNLVHKYIGATENPRLDHLGKKSSWAKTRARVKRIVDSIAEELIELYAKRLEEKGFMYPPDSSFQHDFEAAFPYTETEHQLETIQAIKADMESERAMDRLVCGDVGFGKTEVAIRAAFKAVMAGKQVALLCPTTILAFQHFRSFSQRFADYPVRIDYMSRFRSTTEIIEIKQKLKEGKLDIVIGTHALLASDITYKSLGLLIIDEEQRFGVAHKEKLRQMKHNLDSLALTATPIPRTLHMSLAGIRELSIIETPPADRRKIETHVLTDNEEVLRLAIKRELDRGGQVYVLHNKVKTIQEQALRIHSLVPKSRTAVLHGQMSENAIEEIMVDFYQHAYDILVSTTIIESGIDIPNVNTLIVLNAHEFGLSQLYQLKGRVGRSDKQAYAYFFYPSPSIKTLTGEAARRLEVLAEYDDLGAGFKIAMKDLEIRGAGNILGKEQSGEIMEIGFELYSAMLNDKIRELRGQKQEETEFHSTIVLPCDWYFPDAYIEETRAKMEFYKSISAAESLEDFVSVREALIDRFGPPPETVETMLLYEEIRHLADAMRLERVAVEMQTKSCYLLVGASHRIDMEKMMGLLSRDRRVTLDPSDTKRINLNLALEPSIAFLRELRALLKFLSLGAS